MGFVFSHKLLTYFELIKLINFVCFFVCFFVEFFCCVPHVSEGKVVWI